MTSIALAPASRSSEPPEVAFETDDEPFAGSILEPAPVLDERTARRRRPTQPPKPEEEPQHRNVLGRDLAHDGVDASRCGSDAYPMALGELVLGEIGVERFHGARSHASTSLAFASGGNTG